MGGPASAQSSEKDLVSSDTEDEERERPLMAAWRQSKFNTLHPQVIQRNNAFLWAFGDNQKRALSVQKKLDVVDTPSVSVINTNGQNSK